MKLPKKPVIKTKRLIMRDLHKRDLAHFMRVHGDADVVRYTPHGPWAKAADGEAWLERMKGYRKRGDGLQLTIEDKATKTAIGIMLVFHFNEGTGSGEVGYMLAKEHWGKGLAKEALIAFVDFCFDTLKLKRLEAQLDPRNIASAKVLERAGFKQEGHQRRNHFAKGEVSDTGLYGMLREDRK